MHVASIGLDQRAKDFKELRPCEAGPEGSRIHGDRQTERETDGKRERETEREIAKNA